ncbi:hypothetical protein WICMUC_002936 [Wickerhamomyces mucosus]|uniref:Transcriptional activator HAP2 n=1 Tax=Wickerhamomyces mucosus TaxID=1378264 RepID=A0A9P8TDV9_9ASCO|nr:hypothetical protein WICMUC_002936 [Wickerhamomyces mucosus]
MPSPSEMVSSTAPKPRTPTRTPAKRRRRSTLVSATLITPRRYRRPSVSPQATLRALAGALIKEKETANEKVHLPQEKTLNESFIPIDEMPITQTSLYKEEFFISSNNTDYYMDSGYDEDLNRVPINEEKDTEVHETVPNIGNRTFGELISDSPNIKPQLPSQTQSEDNLENYVDAADDAFFETENLNFGSEQLKSVPTYRNALKKELETNGDTIHKNNYSRGNKQDSISGSSLRYSAKVLVKQMQSFIKKPINTESKEIFKYAIEEYFDQVSKDLSAYSGHTKSKKTINMRNIFVLFKRQKKISSIESLIELVDDNLPLENRIKDTYLIPKNLYSLKMSIDSPQINNQYFSKQNYYTLDDNFQEQYNHKPSMNVHDTSQNLQDLKSQDLNLQNHHHHQHQNDHKQLAHHHLHQNQHPEQHQHTPQNSTSLDDPHNDTAPSYEDFTHNFNSISGLHFNFGSNSSKPHSSNNTDNNLNGSLSHMSSQVSSLSKTLDTDTSAFIDEHIQRHQEEEPIEEASEQPFYVNAKQYHRILKRRIARAKLEESLKVARGRKPYLHESRHKHAMRRPRGEGGRFLTAAEIAEREKKLAEEAKAKEKNEGILLDTNDLLAPN